MNAARLGTPNTLGKRRVLLLSYYFPPMGGTGVLRMLKVAKYLPRHGWIPTVLTVNKDNYHTRDETLLDDLPSECEMIRTGSLDPDRLYRLLRGRKTSAFWDLESRGSRGLLSRLIRIVRSSLFIPDTRIGWLPFACAAGRRAVVNHDLDAVLASGPPHTTLIAGAMIARRTRRPFLADFRDPWTEAYFYPDRPFLADRINRKLEAWVLRQADCITAVGEGVADSLRRKLPPRDRDKVQVLHNGFDPEDFPADRTAPVHPFTLIYCGSLHMRRDPRPLIKALEALAASGEVKKEDFRFRIIGRMTSEIREAVGASPIRESLEISGYLPYRDTLAAMSRASALVLLIEDGPEGKAILTNKIFEYLGCGHPILALAPEGEASDIIHRAHAGLVVPPTNRDAIGQALLTLFRNGRDRVLPESDARVVAGFSRERQAGRFAALLNEYAGMSVRRVRHPAVHEMKMAGAGSRDRNLGP